MDYASRLVAWYEINKREMPWRNTKDPYCIWVSEVMLQQTQVETVIPYYNRFIMKFPTISALAQAHKEEVYKYWEGLGYYRRVDYLHNGAKMIVNDYDGLFPNSMSEIKKIPGIGSYTLGAIMSIAFDKPMPAVDGNVMRILSRQFLIEEDISKVKSKKIFENKVMTLMNHNPSSFNQALMELGALICTPKNSKCMVCPIQNMCMGYKENRVYEFPIKEKKNVVDKEYYIVPVIKSKSSYWFEQRATDVLLGNLWGFPMISKTQWEKNYAIKIKTLKLPTVSHRFTHKIWEIYPLIITSNDINTEYFNKITHNHQSISGAFMTLDEIHHIPIATAFKKIIKLLIKSTE